MKNLLQFWLFLLVLLGAVGTIHAQPLNYSCDFESDSHATEWQFYNGGINSWLIGTAINNTAGGAKALYISNDASGATHAYTMNSTTATYAYKEFDLEVGEYGIAYDWQANGEASSWSDTRWDYLRVALVPSTATLPTSLNGSFYNTLPSGWIALDGGIGLCKNAFWNTFSTSVNITTAGTYKLVFIWRNDSGGGENPPAAVDNIVFKAQSCPKPADLVVMDITSDGATLSWTETGTATRWQLQYTSSTSATSTTLEVDSNPYTITGLEDNTAYTMYLSSVCGSEDMSMPNVVSFRTACSDMVLPTFDDFESYPEGEFPYCWSLKSGGAEIYDYAGNAYSGNMALKIKNNAIVITPKYNITCNEAAIYFAAMQYYTSSGNLEVGYVTNLELWDYTPITTISPSDDAYHLYDVNLETVSNVTNGCYFVFRQVASTDTYSSWYIDDVKFYQLGNCRSATNLRFSSITDCSATLLWDCVSEGANFQIRYNGEVVDVVNATTTTLTGLTPNTVYNIEMRTRCGDTDSTFWRPMGMFKTDVSCARLLNVQVDNYSSTAASISWIYDNRGNPSVGIDILYKASDATSWTSVSTRGNGYILTGLTPATRYDVMVGVLCEQDTSDYVLVHFTTSSDAGCGNVEGDGSLTTNKIPFDGYYNYSYSQSIYLSTEVGNIGPISGIKYHTATNSQTRSINIYMANTDRTAFANGRDYIPFSQMTKVYSGSCDFSGMGWDEITFTTPFTSDGRNIVVCVTDTSGNNIYNRVKFYYHNGSSIYLYNDGGIINPSSSTLNSSTMVPDVRFVGECLTATCKAPLLSFIDATTNSLTFSWLTGLDETAWCVDYRLKNATEWISFTARTTTNTVTIPNLIPGEAYEVRVGSLCTDDTLYALSTGFTHCGETAIPYFNDFSSESINPCWSFGNVNITSSTEPFINNNNQLQLPPSCYVMMSQFDTPITSLQLRFNISSYSDDAYLMIGVCSEQNNISSFEVIDTVYINPTTSTTDVIMRMHQYLGTGQYITFKSGASLVCIDDLNVELLPACPEPIHFRTVALGGTYANIAWDPDDLVNSWQATIVEQGADIATGTTIVCPNATASFTNLTVNTDYDIYVSSVCNTENSEEVQYHITTMATDPIALPYITDFSDDASNAQWSYYTGMGHNSFYIGDAVANNTPKSLYVSNDNGVSNNYDNSSACVSFAYIPVIVAESGIHALQFDWLCSGEGTYDFGRVALVPGSYDFTMAPTSRSNYHNNLPIDWIALDNGRMCGKTSWQGATIKANLTPGTYFLTVVWANDGSGGNQPPFAIDNIEMRFVTCDEPTDLTVSDVTANSATLSWTANPLANSEWQVSINGGAPVSVTEPTYTFNSLAMGTNYVVEVRSICGDEDCSIATRASFFTLCSDIETLPYVYDFNSNSNNDIPNCWTSSNTYPCVTNGTLEFSSSQWDTEINVITMPKLGEAHNLKDVELVFRAKSDSYYNEAYTVQVGVCNVAGGDTSFTLLETFEVSNQWQEYLVTFENYTDTGRYITFKSSRGNFYSSTVFVDDVELRVVSPCRRPIQMSIDSYTHKSAVVTWTDTNSSAFFKVAVSATPNFNDAVIIEGIPSSPYTITDLMGNTEYRVWLAADCPNFDTTSAWVYVGSFVTNPTCAAVTNLHVYDIEATKATVAWDSPVMGEPVTDYIVSVQMNSNEPTIDTIQATHLFLENLSVDSTYKITVTTLCDTSISSNNYATFVPIPVPGCNTIGNGTLYNSNLPISNNYNYSISQFIYTADEFDGMGDEINGISFNRTCSSWNGPNDTRQVVVYMGTTSLSDCSNGWIDTNTLTVVYRGEWNLIDGECPIVFSTPFIYSDRTQNLVVMIDDNTGSYMSAQFQSSSTDNVMAIFAKNDYVNVGVQSEFTTSNERPTITFDATCEPITCFPPSIAVTNVTDTQVDFTWRAGNDESAWQVDYRNVTTDEWTTLHDNISVQSASINGLIPGEMYEIRVGAICGDKIKFNTLAVTTDCGPMPLPFYEDFANMERGNFSKNCWIVYSDSYYNAPYIYNFNINGTMLRFYENSGIALPVMDANLNELQMRFRYYSTDSAAYLLVGYVTNPNRVSTFNVVDTIHNDNIINGAYHTVLFNDIPADAQGQIAFMATQPRVYIHIDDILVEPIRTCVPPTDIQVSQVTTNSAEVSWSGNASSYQVVYGEIGFVIRGESGQSFIVNSNTATLSNLAIGTTYDVVVRSICGEGDTSHVSNAVNFTTECDAISELPYIMDFELPYLPDISFTQLIPNCWTVASLDDSTTEAPQIVSSGYSNSHTNGHYTLRLHGSSIVALPEMGIDLDMLCLQFFNQVNSNSSRIVVGVLDHLGEGCESTFQAIDTLVPQDTYTAMPYSVCFNNYAGTGKYIALRNIDTLASVTTSIQYFDSIVVDYNPSYPVITVLSNDASLGTLTGAGVYRPNATAVIEATPILGYHFLQWNDGNTENPRTIVATQDSVFTATFEINHYPISAVSNNIEWGNVIGGNTYDHGSTATLEALPVTGYHFVSWNDGNTENPRNILVTQDSSFIATFEINHYPVEVTTNNPAWGNVSGDNTYDHGATATLVATPILGYHFVSWNDGNVENPRQVVITQDTAFTALFQINQYELTLNSVNTDWGTVTGADTYDHGSTAIIEAVPTVGYHFTAWNDDITNNPRNVVVTHDTAFTANFAINQYQVTVETPDENKGLVSGSGTYDHGSAVTIEATPINGYLFVSWNDGNIENPRTFVATRDSAFSAIFALNKYDVTVASSNPDLGSVEGGGVYAHGATATLNAIPIYGYHFVNWSDGDINNPRSLEVVQDSAFTANFAINQYQVSVASNDESIGAIEGAGTYDHATAVTLTAVAIPNHHFVRWNDGSIENPRTFVITSDSLFTATFEINHYPISVVSNNPLWGTVSGADTYDHGTQVTLQGIPTEGYHFVSWNDGNVENPRSFTATQDSSFTANFAINQYQVSVASNDESLGEVTGAGTYDHGTTVTLQANAIANHHFVRWSDGNTDNPRTFLATEEASYTATFEINHYPISVVSNNQAWGTVSGTETYDHGTQVILQGIPAEGYHFVCWNDGNTENPRSLIATHDSTFIATFAINTYQVTVESNDLNAGMVAGNGTFDHGTTILLSARPVTGYHFVSWNDGSVENPRSLTVTHDSAFTATFAINQYQVAVATNDDQFGSVTGADTYNHGIMVTLEALPTLGYHFVQWNDGNTNNPRSFVAIQDTTFTATFAINQYQVTAISNNPDYGTVTGGDTYNHGATATLQAIPAEGYHFVSWNDELTTNPLNVVVTQEATYTANFAINQYQIDVVSNNDTYGTVEGSGLYNHGTTITLTATPTAGNHFVSWNDGVTENPRTLVATQEATYTATFAINQYQVSLASNDELQGTVEGSGLYDHGTTITLQANPAEGYHFVTWSDGVTENPRLYVVLADTALTATFAINEYQITAVSNDATYGSITGSGTYNHGATVTLEAIANQGHTFISWNDGSVENPRTIIATQDSTFTANFEVNEYQIALSSNDATMGRVEGSGTYNYGTTITIKAIPAAHHHFISWNDGNTENPRQVEVACDSSFIATFAIDEHEVSVGSNNETYGTVEGGGTYAYGTTVTLKAVPAEGYHFVKWENDGMTTNPRTITVTEDMAFTAVFASDNPEGIDEAEALTSITVYPNPTHGRVTITADNINHVYVYDMIGKKVAQFDHQNQIDLTNLTSGQYVLRIETTEGSVIRKVIKK